VTQITAEVGTNGDCWTSVGPAGHGMTEPTGLTVRFWGVRGTIPCPGPGTLRYGGNTACVEVLCGPARIIFDGGTGLRGLGKQLQARNQPTASHLFFSHTHFDHVGGLPFFKPAYDARSRLELWSGCRQQQGSRLEEVLGTLIQRPFFPVPLGIMHACLAFHDFEVGEVLTPFDGASLHTAPLHHPGGATGYRLECAGRSICYITDTEHPEAGRDANVLRLMAGADLVIYDSTYTDQEYAGYRGWGHSTWQEGVRLCDAAGAKRLVAFHHDPEHDDATLDRIAVELEAACPGSIVAYEGLEICL
jgi:phosphoribosyl 1,2-cyclic phosphodiesterase